MSAKTTFYIFHGDDSLRREAAVADMRERLGEDGDLNCSEFDGTQASVAEALAAVKSLPFLAERRLVIVHGLISHITRRGAGPAGKAATDRLIEALPTLPAFARLVLAESEALPVNNRLLKAARKMKNGYLSAYEAPDHLGEWLQMRALIYGAELSPEAAAAISELLGYDELSRNARSKDATRRRDAQRARSLALRAADNELQKLVAYVDGEREIGEADVAALTPYVPEANVFEMVDALAGGDGARALRLIHQALRDDPGDPGFRLFALITRQFRLLTMTRDYLDRGGRAQARDIAKAVGVAPFVAGKLSAQARRFNIAQLDAILKRLQRYDQDMKTGRIEARLALDLLVTSLARA